MSDHARLSPSAAGRWMLCPGSIAAIEALPPEERDRPSKAAEQGTRRHLLAEWRIHHPTDPWPIELMDKDQTHRIVSEDVAAVMQLTPWYKEVLKAPYAGPHEFWTEEKLEIGRYCGLDPGVLWGTADFIQTDKDTLRICDNKFGFIEVNPDNWQNKCYAVGAGAKLVDPASGQIKLEYRQVRTVELVIAQPTAHPVIKSVRYPLESLMQWARDIGEAGKKALDPASPRVSGESQCQWCPAKDASTPCPEYVAWKQGQAGKALGEMFETQAGAPAPIASVDSIVELAEVKAAQDPEKLTPEDLGKLLDLEPVITGFFKDVKKIAQRKLEAGLTVSGWKLVAGRSSREWNEESESVVESELRRTLKFNVKDCYTQKLITPAQLMDHPKVLAKHSQKEKAQDLWHWKDGKPVLAPECDPRPGVSDAHRMFEPVTETEEKPEWL